MANGDIVATRTGAAPAPPASRLVVIRVVRAAAVGFLLLVLWGAMAALLVSSVPCEADGWGCLGQGILLAGAAGLVALVLAWPLLRLFKVRPAWLVALLGTGVLAVLVMSSWTAAIPDPFGISHLVLSVPAAYALAALLTAPAVPGRYRLMVAAAIGALYPLAMLVQAGAT